MFVTEKPQLEHIGIKPIPIRNRDDGTLETTPSYLHDTLKEYLVNENGEFGNLTTLCFENSHNFCGGQVLKNSDYLDFKKAKTEVLDSLGYKGKQEIHYHLDGSRILNTSVALRTTPSELVKDFYTINICLSKGLGCPMGSVILLNSAQEQDYKKLRNMRKLFVGALRQVGFVAAPAIVALNDYHERFIEDHENAKTFETLVTKNTTKLFTKSSAVTNIVNLYVHEEKRFLLPKVIKECREKHNVLLGRYPSYIRAVFHHQVSRKQAKRAALAIVEIAEKVL